MRTRDAHTSPYLHAYTHMRTYLHHTPHTPSCYPHTHTVSPAPPSPVPTLGGRTVPQMARVRLCQSGGPQKKPPMNDSPGLAVAPERLLSCPVLLLGGRAGCLQQGAGLRLRAPEPWAGGGGACSTQSKAQVQRGPETQLSGAACAAVACFQPSAEPLPLQGLGHQPPPAQSLHPPLRGGAITPSPAPTRRLPGGLSEPSWARTCRDGVTRSPAP